MSIVTCCIIRARNHVRQTSPSEARNSKTRVLHQFEEESFPQSWTIEGAFPNTFRSFSHDLSNAIEQIEPMAPREKEESAKTHDSYGTMTYAGDENDNESGNDNGNVGMTPVETTGRITGNANTNPIDTCSYDYDYEYKCNSNNDSYDYLLPIETAIERVGTGAFQHKILLATGLCFMADAMEVLLLSFLSTVLKHEWNLSEGEVDSIIAVVFAGGLLGTVVLGRAGDVWGRKPVFAVTALLIGTAGVATAFCRTYQELLLARFWVGFGVGGLTVPFDILGEFLPGAARGKNLLYIGACCASRNRSTILFRMCNSYVSVCLFFFNVTCLQNFSGVLAP